MSAAAAAGEALVALARGAVALVAETAESESDRERARRALDALDHDVPKPVRHQRARLVAIARGRDPDASPAESIEDAARAAALGAPTLPAPALDALTEEDVERIDRAIPTLPGALASSLRRLVDRVEHDARARRAAEDTRPTGIAR